MNADTARTCTVRFCACLALLLATCMLASSSEQTPAALPPLTRTQVSPRIWECRFRSRVLGQDKRLVVVLPAKYQAQGPAWPVVYFLHGAGRHCRTLVDNAVTRQALLDAPFVTVHPDGGAGWWIDSPVDSKSRYQSHVTEVIALAEANFNVAGEPAKRGLGGWSMGGYGALLYAEAHPGQFRALATLLPLADFPNPALPKDQNHSIPPVLGRDPALWPSFNPLHAADKLKATAIFHVTGSDAFDRTMNERLHQRLTDLSIPHTFLLKPGRHMWPFVEQTLPEALKSLAQTLANDAAR